MQSPRAHRTTELIKEFARQGHKVTVYAILGRHDYTSFQKKYGITVKNIPLKWQMNPYSSDGMQKRVVIDRVLGRLFGKVFEFPDIELMFRIPQLINKNQNTDLLISIANPHSIHWGCSRAKAINPSSFPPKWISDCGDPFMKGKNENNRFSFFARLEQKFCSATDYITVPVDEAKAFYYKRFRDKIKVIPQGFKFYLPEKCNYTTINNVPTFAYSGTFISDIRNPKLLFEYLLQLNIEFKFIIYTSHTNLIDRYRKELGEKLIVNKPIPRVELLQRLEKMDFLINLENINSLGQIPSKLIDYAISKRPILSLQPNNINKQKLDSFLKGNFDLPYTVTNISQYKIEKVAQQFLCLCS